MANVNPLLLVGAVIGVVTALLVFAYASVKDKKGSMGFERNMADGEIVRRLVQYASAAARSMSSRVASSTPNPMLWAMVSEKRKLSCGT